MISGREPSVWPTARLIARMNDVALRPNAISSAPRALTNAETLSRARTIIASASRERPDGPPRCTLRASRWSVTASTTVSGICAPAALSKNTNGPARSIAGNRRRTSSIGNEWSDMGSFGPWSFVLGPWSLVLGPSLFLGPSMVLGPSLVLGPWCVLWSLLPGPGTKDRDPDGPSTKNQESSTLRRAAAFASVHNGHHHEERQEAHDTVLQAVHEKRRRRNRQE